MLEPQSNRVVVLLRGGIVLLGLVLLMALPQRSRAAGILCGTVRDASTQQPVERAGVFVRTTAGAYTGFHAATDALGKYCIGGIPAGTYDVEVRVDEYLWAYVRNVVVADKTTDVGDALVPRIALLPPTPNPARSTVLLRFATATRGPAALEVIDAAGRRLKGWRSSQLAAATREIAWDLRDSQGRPVPPGRYFVRLAAGGSQQSRSLVRLP